MAANMRKAVNAVTDFVFPVPKPDREQEEHYLVKWGSQDYVSSLPLQMALYFNIFYYPWWLIAEIIMLVAKFSALSTLYQIVIIAILSFMTLIEVIRLYIGYSGNLTEKVPELAGFWLLTILLQLPLVLFLLLNEQTIITPLERSVTIILTAFVVFEVFIGYFAIRAMVNYQVNRFHLQQFTNLEQIEDPYDAPETTVRHRELCQNTG